MAQLAEMEGTQCKTGCHSPTHHATRKLKMGEGIVSMFRVDPDLAGPLMAMVTTNRGQYDRFRNGESRSAGTEPTFRCKIITHCIAGELWQTLLRYSISSAGWGHKGAALESDDGYTRICKWLLEAVMLAGLTQHHLLWSSTAVMRRNIWLLIKTG